jgi:hypothetical protein
MSLPDVVQKAGFIAKSHSPTLLTAVGVTGAVATAYLTGIAAYTANDMIREENNMRTTGSSSSKKEQLSLTWRLYIPAALSGSITLVSIVCANRVGVRRAAALTAALSLSDKAFGEYRDKIIETVGKGKEQKVRDGIIQDRVNDNPPSGVVIVGPGTQLCFEAHTGRYLQSDMETLRTAVNSINARVLRHDNASLADFYDLVGLKNTASCWGIGWTSDKLLTLEFSSVLADDGRTCLSFDYNYTTPLY